jgi:hypothetical protein
VCLPAQVRLSLLSRSAFARRCSAHFHSIAILLPVFPLPYTPLLLSSPTHMHSLGLSHSICNGLAPTNLYEQSSACAAFVSSLAVGCTLGAPSQNIKLPCLPPRLPATQQISSLRRVDVDVLLLIRDHPRGLSSSPTSFPPSRLDKTLHQVTNRACGALFTPGSRPAFSYHSWRNTRRVSELHFCGTLAAKPGTLPALGRVISQRCPIAFHHVLALVDEQPASLGAGNQLSAPALAALGCWLVASVDI